MPLLVVAAWQVGLGCSVMLFLGLSFEHPALNSINATGVACFAHMTLVPIGARYPTWFETLRRLPAASASTGLLLVPIFAILAASIVLGEPPGLRVLAAIVLTLAGGVQKATTRKIFLGGRKEHPV